MDLQEKIHNNKDGFTLDSINSLVEHLNIEEWDAIIIGDGSGSNWQNSCGWAAVTIDRYSGVRKLSYGAAVPGTLVVGELLPYIFALNWYTSKDGPGFLQLKEKRIKGKSLKVHIVSDSEIIVNCGKFPASRKAHKAIWAAMDSFANQGYSINYHHVKRNVVQLNILVDEVSRQARLDTHSVWNNACDKLKKKKPDLPENATIYDFSK